MSLPQPIPVPASDVEVCALAGRWTIAVELAERICAMAQLVPFSLAIISGFRTVDEQLALEQEGRPAAPPSLSTHCSCPATGADLRITSLAPGPYEKALFGKAAVSCYLRWGGGSPVENGIPLDWNHVDLGPRAP